MPSADLLNDALRVLLQFGPERGRPAGERLRERHPDVRPDELMAALQVGRDAEALAHQLTSSCWLPGAVSDRQFRRITKAAKGELLAAFPWLDDDQLGHLVSQAHYWHYRD